MQITITVSEKICKLAKQNGKEVSEFVEEIVEERFPEIKTAEAETNGNAEKPKERKHNLLKFAGMFSGGDGKTSQNYKKILREEVDKVAGFTIDKGNE